VKRRLAYIFLFIFSFQVLPVKEIGKILYKGLITEERSEMDCSEDDAPPPKIKKDSDPFHAEYISIAFHKHVTEKVTVAIHLTESIPAFHVADIFVPPPNDLQG
jgi:hypothetical protein